MKFKYVKPLESEKNIERFENLMQATLPELFREFVKINNGSRPECPVFDTDNTKERVVNNFLSFNFHDHFSIFSAYENNEKMFESKYIPFALDVFGNFLCFNKKFQIIFINHEDLTKEFVANSFDEFLEKLYMIND